MNLPVVTALAAIAIGIYGVVAKRDILRIFISITIMLSGTTVLLVATAADASIAYSWVILVWAVEVLEVIMALAVFLYLLKHNVADVSSLQEFRW